MGEWEGHRIEAWQIRTVGVVGACLVVVWGVQHKNLIGCVAMLSLIVAIHVFAYLLDQHYEKTKDNIKSVFRSFKKSNYIYVDTLNNCVILNNKGKLTKAQFKGDELINVEFDADANLLESFKNRLNAFDISDVLAYKSGRMIGSNYEVYRDSTYVCNAVTLNKINALRKRLLSNTDGLDALGYSIHQRPDIPTDGNVEIIVTVALYSILYLCLVVIEILGFI